MLKNKPGVLRYLAVYDTLLPRFRTFPHGATAMRAMVFTGSPALRSAGGFES